MADYVAVTDDEIDPDGPITSFIGYRFRDNPEAIAEGAADATIARTGWHPWDRTNVLAGGGTIWDHAVNGTVSAIISPDFAQGYEYRFDFQDVSHSAVAAELRLELYAQTAATYRGPQAISISGNSSVFFNGPVYIHMPRLVAKAHVAVPHIAVTAGSGSGVITPFPVWLGSNTAQQMLRARFTMSSGTFTAGRVIMMRRREYRTA